MQHIRSFAYFWHQNYAAFSLLLLCLLLFISNFSLQHKRLLYVTPLLLLSYTSFLAGFLFNICLLTADTCQLTAEATKCIVYFCSLDCLCLHHRDFSYTRYNSNLFYVHNFVLLYYYFSEKKIVNSQTTKKVIILSQLIVKCCCLASFVDTIFTTTVI